jgi:hypothetical protein
MHDRTEPCATTRNTRRATWCALLHCTAELSELWQGPLGAAQRSARLLCLAAAGGDAQELQVCDFVPVYGLGGAGCVCVAAHASIRRVRA